MTRLVLLSTVLVLTGVAADARPQSPVAAPPADATLRASVDQRADALIGLARVAAARQQWRDAHARFLESARLRPFTPALLEEHFWTAVHVDAVDAMALARSLADQRAASRDVFARWLSIVSAASDLDRAVADGLAVAERAATAHPRDDAWQAARATVALRAERDGRPDLAVGAWATVPAPARDARPDWRASFLRTLTQTTSRVAQAPALDRFVSDHPQDDAMRRLTVEAWADAGRRTQALAVLEPLLGQGATLADLRRAADLAVAVGKATTVRAYRERVRARPDATDHDTWALAELLAGARDVTAIRRVLAAHPPKLDACRERLVTIAETAGDAEWLVEVALDLPATCAAYRRLATRVGEALLARGRAADAERWLAPRLGTGELDLPSRLVLARALAARAAWAEIDALLTPVLPTAAPAATRTDAARQTAWARQALGRIDDAWHLAARYADPDGDEPAARAGWAALALSAGDLDAADRLSRGALDSARDLDARVVQAGLAARQGRPGDVRRWLDPVQQSLSDPGALLVWLDAVHAIEGPAASRRALDAHASTADRDARLLARRAHWAADLGDLSAAARDLALVQAADPDLGRRLDARLSLARGDADRAWRLVASAVAQPGTEDDWQALRLDAALASGRWQDAAALLDGGVQAHGADQHLLARARLHLGRDGQLTDADRTALRALVGTQTARGVRDVLAADALARRAPAEALATLGVDPAQPPFDASVGLRGLMADALLALGRAAEAVPWLEMPEAPASIQVRHGRALIALGRADQARARLQTLARSTGDVGAFVAWAEATLDPADRVVVLEEALVRHPDELSLRAPYVQALRQAGRAAAAIADAERLVTDHPGSRDAWRQLIASMAGQRALGPALDRARAALGDEAETRVLLVAAVAEAPRLDDRTVDLVLPWLSAVPEAQQDTAARLRATLGVASGRWPLALGALSDLRSRHPDDIRVEREVAEVTAWSGAHVAAVPLFERYLSRAPEDADAWRQYARLLTWREDADRARAAYARAEALTRGLDVAAEARTRLAILRRDWPEAALAARTWRDVEPRRLDALVDLALALDQSGEAARADEAYAQLAQWPGAPDTVRRTVSAYQWRRTPHGTVGVEVERADAFEGRRLLERRETVLGGDARLGRRGSVEFSGRVGDGRLGGGALDQAYTQGQGAVRAWLGQGLLVESHMGATAIGGSTVALGGLRLGARVGARVGLEVATARRPFWENASTVSAGLQAWTSGGRIRLLGQGPLDVSAGLDVSAISDGNRRTQVDAAVARQFGAGPGLVEVRLSGFLFGFTRQVGSYFSPEAFGRADAEVGVLRWLGRGAAVRDGRFAVRARTGTGLDTNGMPYLLASGGVVAPLGSRLGLSGDARWTTSRRYQAWSATVGLQVGVGADRVARDEDPR